MTSVGLDEDFVGNKDKGKYWYWLIYSYGDSAPEYNRICMRYIASYQFELSNGKRYWKSCVMCSEALNKLSVKMLFGSKVHAIPVSKHYIYDMRILKSTDKLITNPLYAKIHGYLFKQRKRLSRCPAIEFRTPNIDPSFFKCDS